MFIQVSNISIQPLVLDGKLIMKISKYWNKKES